MDRNYIEYYHDKTIYSGSFFHEDKALAALIMEEVCSLGVCDDSTRSYTTCVYVNCSDVFYWGAADAEPIVFSDYDPDNEIEQLYKLWKINPSYGHVKWVCMRRKMRPQLPVEESMKRAGFWDIDLERLPKRFS